MAKAIMNAQVDGDALDALKELAYQRRTSVSVLIRDAIRTVYGINLDNR
jgi:predicted transcriptional regulator